VEFPTFHDDIVIQLPTSLESSARVLVKLYHASVGNANRTSREPIGFAVLSLFDLNRCFIADGDHAVGIVYTRSPPTETTVPQEGNQIIIETRIRSCIYSTIPYVSSLFLGNFIALSRIAPMVEHLNPVLDLLFTGISHGFPAAFTSLVNLLATGNRDRSCIHDSRFLVRYVEHFAFRDGQMANVHVELLENWIEYIDSVVQTPESRQKSGDMVASWFLLEVLIKGIMLVGPDADLSRVAELTARLARTLSLFRGTGHLVKLELNKSLGAFFRDLLEVARPSGVLKMLRMHFHILNVSREDEEECAGLIDFLRVFLTPRTLIYLLIPIAEGVSAFTEIILPVIETLFESAKSTDALFEHIFELLRQFSITEEPVIARGLIPLVRAIGRSENIARLKKNWRRVGEEVPNRQTVYFLAAVAHYVLFWLPSTEFDDGIARAAAALKIFARPISEAERQTQQITQLAMMTQVIGRHTFANLRAHRASQRSKASLEQNAASSRNFDALNFCLQAVVLRLARDCAPLVAFNSVIARTHDVPIPPALAEISAATFNNFLAGPCSFVWAPESNVYHLIKNLFRHLTAENLTVICRLLDIEKATCTTRNRSAALVTRVIASISWSPEAIALVKDTEFGPLVLQLCELDSRLATPGLEDDAENYSDLIFRRAELLSASPDARVDALLRLEAYHERTNFMSEATMARLTAGALVSEYLVRLGRMPNHFGGDSPARAFVVACPSAVTEQCPNALLQDLPIIHGFCTGSYFSEYGVIYLLFSTMELCRRAQMFELASKIVVLLTPVAASRRAWALMQKHFATGVLGWRIVAATSTSNDRSLGKYYRVQFSDSSTPSGVRNFIYRDNQLANLWQVNEKLKASAQFQAPGKTIEVINEGEELVPSTFVPEKYYVHVKAVTQYFTSDERLSRLTVFEQNHNVSRFYFDLPFSKTSQSSIEHCWLKRTIFTLRHPMPYIVRRVEIPPENMEQVMFSPIQYSCQNLRAQVERIEEALQRKDFTALQPLIHGSLLVQVNEGPMKIAEVFLGGLTAEKQNDPAVAELRNVFRQFLDANQRAVAMHDLHAQENQVYRSLQESLVDGLSRITSGLQVYLT
jgi:hypothetical protein